MLFSTYKAWNFCDSLNLKQLRAPASSNQYFINNLISYVRIKYKFNGYKGVRHAISKWRN